MTFSRKVAFITGGASGMGQLAARNLAAKGALVAALDVNATGRLLDQDTATIQKITNSGYFRVAEPNLAGACIGGFPD